LVTRVRVVSVWWKSLKGGGGVVGRGGYWAVWMVGLVGVGGGAEWQPRTNSIASEQAVETTVVRVASVLSIGLCVVIFELVPCSANDRLNIASCLRN